MMTRSRNPDRTRRSILEAAIAEFAAHGFAGARTDAIARSAGVNKRMLYHYFGGKARLYAAALAERPGTDVDAPLDDSLAGLLAHRAAVARQRPDDVRLLMWEALTPGAPDAAGEAIRGRAWQARVATLSAAQRAGRLATDLDPAQLELALTALTIFPRAFRQIARSITGRSPGDADFEAAYAAFLAALANRLAVPTQPPLDAARDAAKPRVRLTAATINRAG